MTWKQVAGMALAVGLGLGVGLASGAATAQDGADVAQGRLTVTGEGRVETAPDMATLSLGVVAEDAEAGVAVREMSAEMARVLARLEAAGIAARDIQTSALSVRPQWRRSRSSDAAAPEIAGFEASTQVNVRLRDLAALGPLLDAVTQDGANLIQGISFGLQETVPYEDAARKAAVAEALRKAALYAEAAGVSLGPILSIEEHGGAVAPRMMRAEADAFAGGSVPVAAGEISLSAGVTLTYALSPPP